MLELILQGMNLVACLVCMHYLVHVAALMPGWREMWGRRLAVISLVFAFTSQIVASLSVLQDRLDLFYAFSPPTWPSILIDVMLASVLIAWRKEAKAFIRCKFVPPEPAHPLRRSTDWAALS